MPSPAACTVWWASVRYIRPWHQDVLDEQETRRLGRFRQPADRARSMLGAALLRLAVAHQSGMDPASLAIDRSCQRCGGPHGRPAVPALPETHVSVSHSGDLVGVAVTAAGPVGIDVEQVSEIDIASMTPSMLSAAEAGQATDAAAFLRVWTRKEAVMKATGDGLAAPMTGVRVTGPHEAPRLLGYQGRPGLAAQLHDLEPARGYLASAAVLTSAAVTVCEQDGTSLLAGPAGDAAWQDH